jgi:hypothetical protein
MIAPSPVPDRSAFDSKATYNARSIRHPTRQGSENLFDRSDRRTTNAGDDDRIAPLQIVATQLGARVPPHNKLHTSEFVGVNGSGAASSSSACNQPPLTAIGPAVVNPWDSVGVKEIPTRSPTPPAPLNGRRSLCGSTRWRDETDRGNAPSSHPALERCEIPSYLRPSRHLYSSATWLNNDPSMRGCPLCKARRAAFRRISSSVPR